MIEVTSRRMECTLLTSNYSQMPAVVLQDFLYSVGGKNLNSAERYDPLTNEWHEIASMTTERPGHQAVVLNGSIYSLGKLNHDSQ